MDSFLCNVDNFSQEDPKDVMFMRAPVPCLSSEVANKRGVPKRFHAKAPPTGIILWPPFCKMSYQTQWQYGKWKEIITIQ